MQEDDAAADALLDALRAEVQTGPPPGVWESALGAAFTAEPAAELASLVPVLHDDAVIPDEDSLVLTDDGADTLDSPDADSTEDGMGPDDDTDDGANSFGDDLADSVDPGADGGIDLGGSGDDSTGDDW